MFVNYNANPSGKATGDCVIRSISTITGLPWRTIYDMVYRQPPQPAMSKDEIIETVNKAVKESLHNYFPQINFND